MAMNAVLECSRDGNKSRAGDTCSEAGNGIPFVSCSNEIQGLILNALVTYGSKIILCYLEQVL